MSARKPRPVAAVGFEPFRGFTGPGRRRTDHPMVVATIVLCLGLITITAIVQCVALFWAGSRITIMIDRDKRKEVETEAMRTSLIRQGDAQGLVLRRLCLNVAKTDDDKTECLAVAPPVSATQEGRH